jgi:gluconate 2-dehydrogenase gamma chain
MSVSRRRFLQLLGAFGAGQMVRLESQTTPTLPQAPSYQAPARPRGLATVRGAYSFLTIPEARFIESAVARIIPSDTLGPGALEAGVPYFIDQQLQGKFGLAANMYMQGPWGGGEATAEQGSPQTSSGQGSEQTATNTAEEPGYQLPITPQELYRLCLAALDTYAEETYGSVFADMATAQQDEMLSRLENGNVTVEPLPTSVLSTFWRLFLNNTKQGYFADPLYGGNQGKVGWQLVGFPGVAAAYKGVIEAYYGEVYLVEPVSIADIQQGIAGTSSDGHALHRDLVTGQIIEGTNHEH